MLTRKISNIILEMLGYILSTKHFKEHFVSIIIGFRSSQSDIIENGD